VTATPPFTQAWFAQDGSRLVVNPSISYPILSPGWFVTPKLQWHYTAYELDPNFNAGSASAARSLPISSIDSGLIFERQSSWLGSEAKQTLEPRLFYALVPYRNQNSLPNFDSADADFNFAELFTENTFTGSDRIAQANEITAAVTTRIIQDSDGSERLRLAFGQRFYFGAQEVTLPGDLPRTAKASDTLFLGSASLGKKWSVDAVLDYSTLTSQIAEATFGFRWQPAAASVLNLSYRYEEASLAGTPTATNQPRISAQWPLSARWYGVATVDYSISDRALAQAVAGFEYKADCWVARIAMSRYAVTVPNSTELSNNYQTHYFLQIEFNGLSSVGFNPLETLQSNIPGYQRINPPPGPGGPFDHYE
jgi:LPS-assembly protein